MEHVDTVTCSASTGKVVRKRQGIWPPLQRGGELAPVRLVRLLSPRLPWCWRGHWQCARASTRSSTPLNMARLPSSVRLCASVRSACVVFKVDGEGEPYTRTRTCTGAIRPHPVGSLSLCVCAHVCVCVCCHMTWRAPKSMFRCPSPAHIPLIPRRLFML